MALVIGTNVPLGAAAVAAPKAVNFSPVIFPWFAVSYANLQASCKRVINLITSFACIPSVEAGL